MSNFELKEKKNYLDIVIHFRKIMISFQKIFYLFNSKLYNACQHNQNTSEKILLKNKKTSYNFRKLCNNKNIIQKKITFPDLENEKILFNFLDDIICSFYKIKEEFLKIVEFLEKNLNNNVNEIQVFSTFNIDREKVIYFNIIFLYNFILEENIKFYSLLNPENSLSITESIENTKIDTTNKFFKLTNFYVFTILKKNGKIDMENNYILNLSDNNKPQKFYDNEEVFNTFRKKNLSPFLIYDKLVPLHYIDEKEFYLKNIEHFIINEEDKKCGENYINDDSIDSYLEPKYDSEVDSKYDSEVDSKYDSEVDSKYDSDINSNFESSYLSNYNSSLNYDSNEEEQRNSFIESEIKNLNEKSINLEDVSYESNDEIEKEIKGNIEEDFYESNQNMLDNLNKNVLNNSSLVFNSTSKKNYIKNKDIKNLSFTQFAEEFFNNDIMNNDEKVTFKKSIPLKNKWLLNCSVEELSEIILKPKYLNEIWSEDDVKKKLKDMEDYINSKKKNIF